MGKRKDYIIIQGVITWIDEEDNCVLFRPKNGDAEDEISVPIEKIYGDEFNNINLIHWPPYTTNWPWTLIICKKKLILKTLLLGWAKPEIVHIAKPIEDY